jgi:hypothetical protein
MRRLSYILILLYGWGASVDLANVERQLAHASAAHAAGNADELAVALSQLAGADAVAELVSTVLSDETRLQAVASNSYRHTNGFLKIVLLASAEFKLRLHLWMRSARDSRDRPEDIHNHRWDFATHILAGSYRYQQFEPDADGPSYYGYVYEPVSDSGSFSLRQRGAERLSCRLDATMSTGSTYLLRAEALHRVIGTSSLPTATLVLQSRAKRATTDQYSSVSLGPYRTFPLERLAPARLERYLKKFTDCFLGCTA